MNNKYEMRTFESNKKTRNKCFDQKDQEASNDNNIDKSNNSPEQTENVIKNDSQTILSDEKRNNFFDNKNNNYNSNQAYSKSNTNYASNHNYNNNYNFNKLKQKTIETVLENEGEENCSYNQISGGRGGENDPIVTFVFYKEENIDNEEENKNEKNLKNNIDFDNKDNNDLNEISRDKEDKSLSLNLNNSKPNTADNNAVNNNFNINDIIDNISQSEIFGNTNAKKEKGSISHEIIQNANNNQKENETNYKKDKNYNSNNNANIRDKGVDRQTVNYDILFSEIVQACPIIQLSADTSKNILVKMPRWISIHDFKTYLSIIKYGIEFNSVFTFNKLLLLSDFFENNDFVEKLVKDHIVPNFDYSNVIDYLENSYLKLSSSKENSLPVNISWFELFIKAIDFVSKNFVFYLNPENSEFLEKLSGLNKKILEELLDKSIEQIISNPFIFDDEIFLDSVILNNISQSNLCENFKFIRHEIFEKLIDFLHNLRNTQNIFDLLMNEYLRISSDESVSEVNNLPNPTLSVDIPVEINNYYKEFTLDLNIYNRMVVFIVYYKKSDDSLNVSFKLKNDDNNASGDQNEKNQEEDKTRNRGSYWDVLGSFGNMIGGSGNTNNNNQNTNSKKNYESSLNKINLNGSYNNKNNRKDHFFSNDIDNKKGKDLNLNKFTSFRILSFMSVVSLNEEKSKTQVNTNIIPNDYNKSAYPIYKINNFSKYIDDLLFAQSEEINNFPSKSNHKNPNSKSAKKVNLKALAGTIEFVSLKINLKLCNIHSAITSYILKYYHKFYFDTSIYKISKQLFSLLIKNRSNKKHNEDHVVIALLNWLNDEINLNEECEDICQAIDWENVSAELILEFSMKYPKIMKNCRLEKAFEQSLQISLLKTLHSENSLINSIYNAANNTQSNMNSGNNLDKRLIEESVFGTVSLMFKNLIKVGNALNYTNNYVQIKKYSRLNSINFGNYSYKSNNNQYSQEAPYYCNTDTNREKNFNKNKINSGNLQRQQQKASSRNKKEGNLTSARSNKKHEKSLNNRLYSKSTEPNEFNKIVSNTETNYNANKEFNKNLKNVNHGKDKNKYITEQENKRYYTDGSNFQEDDYIKNENNNKFQNIKTVQNPIQVEIKNLDSLEIKDNTYEILGNASGYDNKQNSNNTKYSENNFLNSKKDLISDELNFNSKQSGNKNNEIFHVDGVSNSNIVLNAKEIKTVFNINNKNTEILDESDTNKILEHSHENIKNKNDNKIINSSNSENNNNNMTKFSNNFSELKGDSIQKSNKNQFYSAANSKSSQVPEKTSNSKAYKSNLKAETFKKITTLESNLNNLDSEFSYFSANNHLSSDKQERKISQINSNNNVNFNSNISIHNKSLNKNLTYNNLQSIIDEERTLEVNYQNEKNIFSTFNNAIQMFDKDGRAQDNSDNLIINPNENYCQTEDNNCIKNKIDYKNYNNKIGFKASEGCEKNINNKNICNNNIHLVINSISKSNLDKTNPNNKSISKSKTNNLVNNRSLTPNHDSTNCNTNTNNMIYSSSNSNSNSNNIGNLMHNNVNNNNTSSYKFLSNSNANCNNLKGSLVFNSNLNKTEFNKMNSKNKFGYVSRKKSLNNSNNNNTINKSNTDLLRSESDFGRNYQEKENAENKIYLKTENSNNQNNNSKPINKPTNFTAFNSAFNPKPKGFTSDSNTCTNISNFLKNRVERKQIINNNINNSVNFNCGNIKKLHNNTSLLEYSSNNVNVNKTNNALNLTMNKDLIINSVASNFNNFLESKKTKNENNNINGFNNQNFSNTNNNVSLNFNTSSESNLITNAKNSYNYMNSNSKSKLRENSNKKPALISLLKTNSSVHMGNSSEKEPEIVSRNKNKISNNNSNINNRNNQISSSQALLNIFNKKTNGNNVNISGSISSISKINKK